METVVIVVRGGVPEIVFQSDLVDVTIIDFDNDDTYLYRGNLICRVTEVNDDGTLTLKSLKSLKESHHSAGHYFNVQPGDIELYHSSDLDDDYYEDVENELCATGYE